MQESKQVKDSGKGNIYIRNMLANMERTFLPIGSAIGKYRIIEEIDRGGMAVVYKATQLDLDREVALKVMPANLSLNRRFMERFMSEAHAVARLSHPNIVSIHEVAVENNIYYLAMEYIPGQNLFYYLNFNKPKLVDVLEIVSKLADALYYAHEQKIIHRDLKLNNVIMRDRLTPVLIDFGLAKALEDEGEGDITRTGELLGSPAYMAPERLLGAPVDHRSDVCSLGIMLYEMLTFKNPYLDQRNLHQTALNVMEATPIPPRKLVPWLPTEIEAITLKAMTKDPLRRYQTMQEFREDIMRYQRNEPVLAQPPSLRSRVRHFVKRQWPLLGIAATILVFSALFALSLYLQTRKEKSHWQPFFSERFSGKLDVRDWRIVPQPDTIKPDTTVGWNVANGVLVGQSPAGLSFARLERRFNHDAMIEFDVGAPDRDLFNAGFFLFGDTPDSAYCFHINRKGDGSCGITYPGSGFLLQTAEPAAITLGPVNHVVIERIQNSIGFSINGVMVAKIWDFLPPLGKTHERLGFFVDGSAAWFDNLRISRRAIPLTPSPTLVADRFWERGDFEAALEEYRSLLADFGSSDRSREIQLKIADCLVRLGRYDDAKEALDGKLAAHGKDESLESRRLFLEGIIRNGMGDETAADSVFNTLAGQYPGSPANISAMVFAINRLDATIRMKKIEEANREITLFAGQYPKYADLWSKLNFAVMERYRGARSLDSAVAVAERLTASMEKYAEVLTSAKTALGTLYLDKGRKERAGDLFNQCITAHGSSESVWESWMGIAGIYEYDFSYPEAMTIFQKVYRESPKELPVHWMAGIRFGELAVRDSSVNFTKQFEPIVKGDHPFPLPRLIARFYLGEINESQFKSAWNRLRPDDYSYLYYFARKAMFKREEVVARIYLQDFKDNIANESWDYVKTVKALNNLKRW
jgi:serine/threonine protein kinase/tetratricopeptide (TPR) repeat protein